MARTKQGRMGSIWLKRLEISLDFLERGIDVVLSDADALWLRSDITHDLSRLGTANNSIVASRAWWPIEQYKQWGATACMGFAYFRAARPVQAKRSDGFSSFLLRLLISQLKAKPKQSQDDQALVNAQLGAMHIQWPANMSVAGNTNPDHGTVLWNGQTHGVVLLPHHRYLRTCHKEAGFSTHVSRKEREQVAQAVSSASLAHCRLPKGQMHAKRLRLAAYKMWRLNVNWRRDLGRYKKRIRLRLHDMMGLMQYSVDYLFRPAFSLSSLHRLAEGPQLLLDLVVVYALALAQHLEHSRCQAGALLEDTRGGGVGLR